MQPCYPVQAGEYNEYRAWQKDSIRKSKKRRESTIGDKSHNAALERVHIQRDLV